MARVLRAESAVKWGVWSVAALGLGEGGGEPGCEATAELPERHAGRGEREAPARPLKGRGMRGRAPSLRAAAPGGPPGRLTWVRAQGGVRLLGPLAVFRTSAWAVHGGEGREARASRGRGALGVPAEKFGRAPVSLPPERAVDALCPGSCPGIPSGDACRSGTTPGPFPRG